MTSIALPATRSWLPFGRRRWFIATIFSSAFLLFMVQPMTARMALPRLGGSPSVWNSAMLVYQALLLAGYAYAHFIGRLAPRRQAFFHTTLLVLAALTLPMHLMGWTPPPDANAFLWVPWLFIASIGPLFFVMSAHAPLLQRWYSLSDCGDPYPLYAASNFGSFLGLLSYPLIVEPVFGIPQQSAGWSIGYLLLILLVVGSAYRLPAVAQAADGAETTPAPSLRTMARWALLAAIPSGMILSTTLNLTTDIVAMPLLWVIPLGLYLLSFSVAFAIKRSWCESITRIAPIFLLAWMPLIFANDLIAPFVAITMSLSAMFCVAVALHGQLFESRPAPDQLTRFYLVMSFGGVLGGLFAALIAPLIFDWSYEHPIFLIIAALLLPLRENPIAPIERWWERAGFKRGLLILSGAMLVLVVISFNQGNLDQVAPIAKFVSLCIALFLGVAAVGRPFALAVMLAGLMMVSGGAEKLKRSLNPGVQTRSYFGIYVVADNADSRRLIHGTTNHGIENLGSPQRERMATTYYYPLSGVGMAMSARHQMFGEHPVVDVVGLGAGTLACYAKPGEAWTFYEIDPAIVRIARDEGKFRFLARCTPDVPIVVGDARLTLAQQPERRANLLVVDAFSSDSVPMHLLTKEAMAVYERRLAPGGLLMIHISNRYLNLAPVLAANGLDGWTVARRVYLPKPADQAKNATGSEWIALSRDPATIEGLRKASLAGGWEMIEPTPGFERWTDDHATILPLIRWR